jgi:large subunit ribosomal protein L18
MKTPKTKIIINRSHKGIFAQVIDTNGNTVIGQRFDFTKGTKPVEQAGKFGEDFGKKAVEKKIVEISFDRNGRRYHGQIKSFAEGLRNSGLKF